MIAATWTVLDDGTRRGAKRWPSRSVAWLVAIATVFHASVAVAQSVRWNVPTALGQGQIAKVELVFENCEPTGSPQFPETPGVESLGEPSEFRSFSMVNFKSKSTVTLGYPVRVVHKTNQIQLPSFEIDTSEGRFLVPAATVRVTGASVPGAPGQSQPLAEVARGALDVSNRWPWVGEVLDLEFDVLVDARRSANLAGTLEWDADPMVVEPWSEPTQIRPEPGWNGVRVHARGLFNEPGSYELEPVMQDVNIETERGRGGLFRSRRMRTVTVNARAGLVAVRPLPEPALEGFGGAVGQFELHSRFAPQRARVGEPLTWTLTLSGRGNWTTGVGLPARSVPNDIEVIRPKTMRDFEEGALFEGRVSEDLVMIPTRAGRLQLEPVRFVYFDPSLGRYDVAEVQPPPIEVLPALSTGRTPVAPGVTPGAPPIEGSRGDTVPARERLPEAMRLPGDREDPRLPREPVGGPSAGRGLAAPPLSRTQWLVGFGFAAVPGLLAIVWLGRRRAVRADALGHRRRSLARLGVQLETPGDAASPGRASLLEWQREAATLLGVEGRAPTVARMDTAGWGAGDGDVSGVDVDAWRSLWLEADAVIHQQEAACPRDWIARARHALEAVKLRPVPFIAGLRPRTLWPALLLCLAVLTPAGGVDAESERPGVEAYRAGRFEEAVQLAQARVDVAPLDWRARSDLGLALLQAGDLDAALAETSAAFVLRPGDEHVRWNLDVVSRRAGWIDPAVEDLASGNGLEMIARQWSVIGWQVGALLCFAAAWGALAVAVARRHAGVSSRAPFVVAAVALALAGTCAAMVVTWGPLGEPGAAIVRAPSPIRSLPSELVDDQVEAVLEAGRVVVADRRFLGWVRVRLANGDRGWVRDSVLGPLYRSLPDVAPPGPAIGSTPDRSIESAGAQPPPVRADDGAAEGDNAVDL